jgi:hypothetical protein
MDMKISYQLPPPASGYDDTRSVSYQLTAVRIAGRWELVAGGW